MRLGRLSLPCGARLLTRISATRSALVPILAPAPTAATAPILRPAPPAKACSPILSAMLRAAGVLDRLQTAQMEVQSDRQAAVNLAILATTMLRALSPGARPSVHGPSHFRIHHAALIIVLPILSNFLSLASWPCLCCLFPLPESALIAAANLTAKLGRTRGSWWRLVPCQIKPGGAYLQHGQALDFFRQCTRILIVCHLPLSESSTKPSCKVLQRSTSTWET